MIAPPQDVEAERKALVRDFLGEALAPAARELDSAMMSLENDDDQGASYHFRRLVAAIKHAALGFQDLSS
jgi:hypothetical protein